MKKRNLTPQEQENIKVKKSSFRNISFFARSLNVPNINSMKGSIFISSQEQEEEEENLYFIVPAIDQVKEFFDHLDLEKLKMRDLFIPFCILSINQKELSNYIHLDDDRIQHSLKAEFSNNLPPISMVKSPPSTTMIQTQCLNIQNWLEISVLFSDFEGFELTPLTEEVVPSPIIQPRNF